VKLEAYPLPGTGPPAVDHAAGRLRRLHGRYEEPDALSPAYRPGAPVRSVVGVELWPEIAGQGHPDGQRATVLTAADGGYRFQSDPPEHIHMLVSAEGFEPLASNRYHPEGRAEGRFDILLTPARS
jgi:hypothetical protein